MPDDEGKQESGESIEPARPIPVEQRRRGQRTWAIWVAIFGVIAVGFTIGWLVKRML